ncbi:SSI family serine proteinase inhibitor [Actinokineospora auranticolor]|uniref:Subtilisin inhibitor-like n=1 Tax=Actinokineospora auranticolor TaxID=155976 RepID=A0A2S6GNL5_9PSEU|nr:SSI family serine proteinase inhibitor [Actinokineospora auranticolor]PPK66832.1 subtilisin inhibitor-like [Actinokineospora auranticolor]
MSAKRLATAAACAVAAALVPATAAQASTAPVRGALLLTVTTADGRSDVAYLECAPDRGTHAHPTAACAALSQVNGDVAQLPGNPGQLCTLEYAPARATVHGLWGPRFVRYQQTHPNRCALAAATGPVFDL